MGSDIRSALASKVVLLDKMKNVSTFVKVVFDVGKEISEVTTFREYINRGLNFFSSMTWQRWS